MAAAQCSGNRRRSASAIGSPDRVAARKRWRWLEQRGRAYALMIPQTIAVRYRGRSERAEQLGARLPTVARCLRSSGADTQGGASHQLLRLTRSRACADGMRRWLLVRHSADEPGDLAYSPAYETAELVCACDARLQVEEGFAQAKGEAGLDRYEIRNWVPRHHFVTLCLEAHAYPVVLVLLQRNGHYL